MFPRHPTTLEELRVTTQKGDRVTLTFPGHPELTFIRLSNRSITARIEDQPLPPDIHLRKILVANPRRSFSRLAHRLLNPDSLHYDDLAESSRSILNRMPDSASGRPPVYLSNTTAKALSQLVDPRTWDQSHRLTKTPFHPNPYTVTLNQYNWVAAASPILNTLLKTNPGAVTWLMLHCPKDPEENIQHPSQIISTVRENMRRHGLPDNCWKTAATLPPHIILACATFTGPKASTSAIRAIVAAGALPGPGTASALTYALATRQQHRSNTPLGQTNLQAFAVLACRADQGRDIIPLEHFRDAIDYTLALTAEGKELRSTTWNGFVKAATKWHQRFRRQNTAQLWANLLQKTNGNYRAWNSLIPPTTTHGVTVTPLTTEKQLFQESLDMEHCVLTYGYKCSAGQSRIFSLTTRGIKTSTGEISLGPKGWTSTQTLATRNRPATRQDHKAMTKITKLYNEAWNKPSCAKHYSVYIHDE